MARLTCERSFFARSDGLDMMFLCRSCGSGMHDSRATRAVYPPLPRAPGCTLCPSHNRRPRSVTRLPPGSRVRSYCQPPTALVHHCPCGTGPAAPNRRCHREREISTRESPSRPGTESIQIKPTIRDQSGMRSSRRCAKRRTLSSRLGGDLGGDGPFRSRRTVVAVNPAYCALYGLTPEQVVGQSFAIIFPEEARAAAVEQYHAVFADPDPPPSYESRVQHADGSERFVEAPRGFPRPATESGWR